MKSIRSFSWLKLFVLAIAVLAGTSTLAHAQLVSIGSFKLTQETHWGPATLTPGEYKFTVDSTSFPARVMVRNNMGDPAAIVLSMAMAIEPSTAPSTLNLERRGAELYVSSLYMNDLGMKFIYLVPKAKDAPIEAARMQAPDSRK